MQAVGQPGHNSITMEKRRMDLDGQLVILASACKAFTVSPPLCAHSLERRWKIIKSLQTMVNIMKTKYREPREDKMELLTWSGPEHPGS